MAEELWVDRRHPDYDSAAARRKYSRDHYTGEVLIKSLPSSKRVHTNIKDDRNGVTLHDSRIPSKMGVYLHQRAQGESDDAFDERSRISRYPGHMSAIVDSFVGGVFSVEDRIERVLGDNLGGIDEPRTPFYTLWRDIDGSGTNWLTRLIQDTSKLIVDEVVWHYADRSSGRSRIFSIDPDMVVQWREEEGHLVEVLMEEFPVFQPTLVDKPVQTHEYVHYTLDGWTRYRVIKEGDSRRLEAIDGAAWKFNFYTDSSRTTRRLPILRTQIPVNRPVGYQMARDANALYNMLSDARWLYRVLNYPRLKGNVEDSQWETSLEALRDGMNALQGDWDYISPPHMNAASVYEDYRHEVREFYLSNHQRANQSSIERSATEVLYNEAAGRTAFLTLLSQTVDEMENGWLSLLNQLESPTSPNKWDDTYVRRSRDFKPIDADLESDRRANRFGVYANSFPAPLALQLAGHDEETVGKANTFDPAPEDGFSESAEEFIPPTTGEEPEVGTGGDTP